MASKSQSYEIQRQFKRTNDVEVSKVFTENVQLIASAHLANGSLDEAMACMNMLGKVRAKTETEELKDMVKALLAQVSVQAGASPGPPE